MWGGPSERVNNIRAAVGSIKKTVFDFIRLNVFVMILRNYEICL